MRNQMIYAAITFGVLLAALVIAAMLARYVPLPAGSPVPCYVHDGGLRPCDDMTPPQRKENAPSVAPQRNDGEPD